MPRFETALTTCFVWVFAAIPLLFLVWIVLWETMKRWRRFHDGPVVPGPRCASCGYNLTGNTSGVCPECGANL